MTDFFDDFGWEDMAFWGGMADEFAEEEREQRRMEQEQFGYPDDEFDKDWDSPRLEYSRPQSSGIVRREPFEQYVDDVCHKRKSVSDPLIGPSKAKKGLTGDPSNLTDTVLYGVKVKNAHLVSENFLKFIYTVLYAHRDNDLKTIVFDPNGRPVVDGKEVFGIYDAGTRTIVLNLRRHFGNAMRVIEHGITGHSMHALIWSTMVLNFLHELKHALDRFEYPDVPFEMRDQQEAIAEQWASEARTWFAREGHCEKPLHTSETYFGPLMVEFLDRAVAKNQPEWAVKQKDMLSKGTYYRNEAEKIEIESMQEYYNLSCQGLKEEGFGRILNMFVEQELHLEEEIWRQEELNELALREAISVGHRIRIDYTDPNGQHTSQVMVPQKIIRGKFYLWVESLDEQSTALPRYRVDLIEDIVFLA
jgi:hypothetical protein